LVNVFHVNTALTAINLQP